MGWFDQTGFKLKYLNLVKSNANVSKKSKLENRRYLIIAIIGAIAVISVVAVVRLNSEDLFVPPPPGVGEVGSDHADAKIGIYLINEHPLDNVPIKPRWFDFDSIDYKKYEQNSNKYIFMDSTTKTFIHRVAEGATLGMYFEDLGMKFTDECFILPEGAEDSQAFKFFQTEFCNDGDTIIKLYLRCKNCLNGTLVQDVESYFIQDGDALLIVYDEGNPTERHFK